MGWSSGLESGGTRFDSRLAQVIFWSGWGNLFINFGMSWDVSGSGLGTFSDGFGMVLEKNVRQGREIKVLKTGWEYFFPSPVSYTHLTLPTSDLV